MVWYRRIYFFLLIIIPVGAVHAQSFKFSSESDRFVEDVILLLKSDESQSGLKVAFDFRSVWGAKLTSDHKTSIMDLCRKMEVRKFDSHDHFIYFFDLMTYSLTQERANTKEFSKLMSICHYAVDNYKKGEVSAFFETLIYFFARGILYSSNRHRLTTDGGSFSIELLPEAVPVQPKTIGIDALDEEIEEEEGFISAEEVTEEDEQETTSDDRWGSDDGWGASEETESIEEETVLNPMIERQVFSSQKVDLVEALKAEDVDPVLGGPVIHLTNFDFTLDTPYDTLKVKNASGSFMIKDLTFIGKAGELDWPSNHKAARGAKVILDGYSFNARFPHIRTTRAKLEYPDMFDGFTEGAFYYKSGRKTNSHYPQFISFQSDIELKLSGDNLKYTGGFAMKADKKFGTSVSKDISTLTGIDGRGRSFKSEAIEYQLEDSLISSDKISFVLYHGSDSIYHPVVKLDYKIPSSTMIISKDRGAYRHTYFFSSFFKLEFKADLIEWGMKSDSLDISILNAQNRIPAVFESEEYFNPLRFKKMAGLYGFHPLMVVVRFSRMVQNSEFNSIELSDHFEIDPVLIRSALLYLKQNGYILFNEESGQVNILRKAFHYVLSNRKKKDFDNILISSLNPGGPNASLNFKTGEMTVRGVKKVFITSDRDIHITPDHNIVTLLEDKDMKFNGAVNAGDFLYKGHDFIFNYDEYLISMETIDSISVQIDFHDGAHGEKTTLSNHLTQTSGTLYINHPKNKAGVKNYAQYPYFVSDSQAIVYFDDPETLNGAYDKSIYFIIPPFEIDSIDRKNPTGIGFEGTFHAGGIIPPFEEYLNVMPDRSLGFNHTIPPEGYALYGREGVLYDSLSLNFDGLRANGRIDYHTTTISSNDFVFYMDSVTAIGNEGIIREGQMGDASYPEAVLTDYQMLWLPLKDSMYIENREEPFQFYGATASLDGKANITSGGVYGSGEMLSRGSKSISKEFHFSQFEYSGRHAKFQILTDDPDKPAMDGDDIAMNFDLVNNIADIHPELAGVAAISFPYAKMKTSITDAIWYLDSAKITMSKPELVDIKSSYFYTTREELDSLAFNATDAIYDLVTYELNIKGIPFIKVADAEIIPDNNETTILENSVLQPLENAKLKIDTLNGYHNLFDGNIIVISRKKFEGYATYELITSIEDTIAIKFESFELKGFQIGKHEYDSMTVSGGTILESQNAEISPGFLFAGDVTMYADRPNLELSGKVKPLIKSLGEYDYWINYESSGDSAEVRVDLATATTTEGEPVVAGVLYNNITNEIYMSFVNEKIRPEDGYLFQAEGILSCNYAIGEFKIEEVSKSLENSYSGKSFIYDDINEDLIFEGPIKFINNISEFNINATALGVAKPDSNTYSMDAMLGLNMKLHPLLITSMVNDISEVVARVGLDVAHSNSIEMLYKLADLIGDESTKEYENSSMNEYRALNESSPLLNNTLFISNIDIDWSHQYTAFHNKSKIGLSHILSTDINALVDGFFEVQKSDEGDDILSLFLQIAPSTWYYFGYEHGRLLIFTSNTEFNSLLTEYSTISKSGFGEYTTVLGDEFEVLKFVNDFRSKYYGITDPYNLEYPGETHLEEDNYDTIEKDKYGEESEAQLGDTEVEEESNNFEELEEDKDDGF